MAKSFIKRIQLSSQSAFKNIIEVGKTLQKAKAELEKKEWLDMVSHELPFTRRTVEKLIKIAADTGITDPKNANILPPSSIMAVKEGGYKACSFVSRPLSCLAS